eukprot:bmy_01348T0
MAPALLTTLPGGMSLRSLEPPAAVSPEFPGDVVPQSSPLQCGRIRELDAEREDKVLTLSLEDEHLLYGNIIQDFLDTYNNLTLKTIMAFKWVTEFCPNARYITKRDTDVFINTGNLGYPFKVFPPYCSGLGYIISRNLVPRIYEMMSHVKPIKFEDVYVGICLTLLKVDIHIPEDTNLFFLYRIHLNKQMRKCALIQIILVIQEPQNKTGKGVREHRMENQLLFITALWLVDLKQGGDLELTSRQFVKRDICARRATLLEAEIIVYLDHLRLPFPAPSCGQLQGTLWKPERTPADSSTYLSGMKEWRCLTTLHKEKLTCGNLLSEGYKTKPPPTPTIARSKVLLELSQIFSPLPSPLRASTGPYKNETFNLKLFIGVSSCAFICV